MEVNLGRKFESDKSLGIHFMDGGVYRVSDLVLEDKIKGVLGSVISGYIRKDELRRNGLRNVNKLLFFGDTDLWKSLSSMAVANELSLPHYKVLSDGDFGKLCLVFDFISCHSGVYVFEGFESFIHPVEDDVSHVFFTYNLFLSHFLDYLDIYSDIISDSIIILPVRNFIEPPGYVSGRFDVSLKFRSHFRDSDLVELFRFRLFRYKDLLDFDKIVASSSSITYKSILSCCDEAMRRVVLDGVSMSDDLLLDCINSGL